MNRIMTVILWALTTTLTFSIMGCASEPVWYKQSGTSAVPAVRDREAELAQLRADIATARIIGAKKEAELQELRRTVAGLRQDATTLHQTMAELRRAQEASAAETAALRKEREQLLHTKSDEQLNSLRDLVSTLTKDLEQLKQGLAAGAMSGAVPENQPSSAVPLRQGFLGPLDQSEIILSEGRPSLSMRRVGRGGRLRMAGTLDGSGGSSPRIAEFDGSVHSIAKEAGMSMRHGNPSIDNHVTPNFWSLTPALLPPVQ